MPYKNLEHDGVEDFTKFSNREKVKQNRERRLSKKPKREERLARQQKKYLSIDNPALWDGDPDT
jgi:hypothetical protein